MVDERMDTDEVPDKDQEAKKNDEPKPGLLRRCDRKWGRGSSLYWHVSS